MKLTASDAAVQTRGEMVGNDAVAHEWSFDSRSLIPGEGFIALRGERDGNEFVGDAFERGAAFVVAERVPGDCDGTVVVVGDSLVALAALGSAARDAIDATVVAITGSAGKTSTKDLVAAAVGVAVPTHACLASLNNEIGLPVTLLNAPESARAVVLEMGARFAGNISTLCEIARPSIGVITNIGMAHAEHLGGREGIATVKGELLDALPDDGLAVLNADCDYSLRLRGRASAQTLIVGESQGADVLISAIELDDELRPKFRFESPWGSALIRLSVRGFHQAINAAQAATVALYMGADIDEACAALATCATSGGRMRLTTSHNGVQVLDDSYNASPAAMLAALDALARLPVQGRRIAVLGEMRELGAFAAAEHSSVGDAVVAAGVDILILVCAGTDGIAQAAAKGNTSIVSVADGAEAAQVACQIVSPGDAVLVKASHAVGLEVVAEALLALSERVTP